MGYNSNRVDAKIFADYMKISQVRYGVVKISQGWKRVVKFLQCWKGVAKISSGLQKFRKWWKVAAKFPSVLRKFLKWLRNSSVLDSFSDSLPCTLDWFRKDFEALQNLDSSCNLASILLCHGLYQVLPHSWFVLMIKKL